MMLPNAQLLIEMLRNKRNVVETILADYVWAEREGKTYENRIRMISEGKTIKPEVMLTAMAKSMTHLMGVQMRISLLLLVYLGGDNFDSDSARLAMKLGANPQDTLREMMKRKMGR
jgi:hypothetical protein